MKILSFLYFFLLPITFALGQKVDYKINDNIVNSLAKNTSIIALGDPTHQEGTITEYRIDLIKKLVLEKDFKIIAIEGNMYELYKANQLFIKDRKFAHYENAMYGQLNAIEMETLYEFIYEENKKGNKIQFLGFDPAFSGTSFAKNIEEDLNRIDNLSEKEKKDFVKNLKKATNAKISALFRNNKKVKEKIVTYSEKILDNFKPLTQDDYFFCQALKNIIFLYNNDSQENYNPENSRDIGMAMNFDFIQSQFPKQKIILFGSSTHLYKNPKAIEGSFFQNNRITFGHLLYDKFKEKYFYIAYTSLSGTKYNWLNKNKPKTISEISEKSIEYRMKEKFNTTAVYITKETLNLSNQIIESRFLGHSFIALNLWQVMDGLVLIKNVKPFVIKTR